MPMVDSTTTGSRRCFDALAGVGRSKSGLRGRGVGVLEAVEPDDPKESVEHCPSKRLQC